MKTGISQEKLKELLYYEPHTGVFRWKKHVSVFSRVKEGVMAGGDNGHGYVRIRLLGKMYMAHRLAWLYVTGEWPSNEIDHINGNKHDNRIENLRDASKSINKQNMRTARSDNSSGALGAHWSKRHKKYQANIRVSGRLKHLGYFDSAEQANNAYVNAKRNLHDGCTI